MKRLTLLLLIGLISKCHSQQSDKPLFKIIENNRIGYIDSTGKVIIKPQFLNAGDFSEGLAYARTNGTYGYINQSGEYVIQPQFDYAMSFKEDIGYVVREGKPFYINRQGQRLFNSDFSAISAFENGRARVSTLTEKWGCIDKQGKFVIDTVFKTINPFIDGLAVVRGLGENFEVGVINTAGKFVIPYEKFNEINDLKDGYFKVGRRIEYSDSTDGDIERGFVDRSGQIVVLCNASKGYSIEGNMNSGLAKMIIYKYSIPDKKGSILYDKGYAAYINLKGEIAINDTNYKYVEDFSENRAFVKGEKDNYYSLIDTEGKALAKKAFFDIKRGFKSGKAFVRTQNRWGLIDTTGSFVMQPQFKDITTGEIIDDYFFFEELNKDGKGNYGNHTGVADIDGTIIIEPMMEQVDLTGFHHGLLRCFIDEKLTYINKKGEIVWKAEENKISENPNIDFMNRGYFYAYSKPNVNDLGGFGSTGNVSKSISNLKDFPANRLSVVVRLNKKGSKSGGVDVFVANTSKKSLDFNAQDSRLYMKVQALDKKGIWRDIEYLPVSWCGNSYHTLTLEPSQFWKFITPVYEGDFKTKLRIELKYIDPSSGYKDGSGKKEIVLYSNEYMGSVNPGQFWRKQDYSPGGIMDPYID